MKRKRVWIFLAACLAAVAVTACSAAVEDTEDSSPKEAEEVESPLEETSAGVEEEETPQLPEDTQPAEDEEPAESEAPTVEDALAYVDQDVSALYEAIGEPLSSAYEASCAGDGDDGILKYDGFTVFTYREPDGSAETVIDAE